KALALAPDMEPAALRVLEYGMKVDPDQAIDRAREYLQQHPEARKLPLVLVNRLVERNDFDGALARVGQMRNHAPEDFDLLYTEAEVNIRAQRYDQAKALLEEYISVQTQRRQSLRDDATSAVADSSDARLLLVQIAEKQNKP